MALVYIFSRYNDIDSFDIVHIPVTETEYYIGIFYMLLQFDWLKVLWVKCTNYIILSSYIIIK